MDRSVLAKGKVELAIRRCAGRYPFYAKVLEQMELAAREDVGTMGVAIANQQLHLLFDSEFVLSINLPETVGTLLHEANHVVLGHLTQTRDKFSDREALTLAQEISANEPISEPLPGQPITLDLFPGFPRLESTPQRYDRLVRLRKQNQLPQLASATIIDNHSLWPADGDPCQANDNDGSQQAQGQANGNKRPPADDSQTVIDDALEQALADSGSDNKNLPPSVRRALRERGIGSRGVLTSLSGNGIAKVPWQLVLRRYVRCIDRRRRTRKRPNRRYAGQPGWIARPGRVRVMAVVDTSGSISDAALKDISKELAAMHRSSCIVTVVEADDRVHRVYPYKPLTTACGRGGTDFRPALAPQLITDNRPVVVVYFTDGLGPAPEAAPPVQVVWCLVPPATPPATWGEVIRM